MSRHDGARSAITESEQEDRALVASVAAGDSEALDTLYCKHKAKIESFLRRKFGDALLPLSVRDVVQDVFAKIKRNAGQYKPTGKVLSWIRKMAENVTLDAIKQQTRRLQRDTDYAIISPPQGGEVEADRGTTEDLYVMAVPARYVIRPRPEGGSYFVWFDELPIRRMKVVKRDRARKWMQGCGPSDVWGYFGCFGVVRRD